ncbi:hypothetical protein Clacol_004173 [Clathrus columnatus]|uniref:NmrA-like domain-containing protein n=1 Tax=Clathrus columnatus TaxID=1419009 RepID=A0AAV5A9Q3_9AGAM|nr:hypothetical protein Clacol_004173 [Clathrus columnatus]
MSSSKLTTVLVAGAGGNTGVFVNVILLTRPGSEGKSRVQFLKEKGAKIRFGDVSKDSVPELEKVLEGVNVVLSLVSVAVLNDQKKLFQAAKNAGVDRVIPSDFATASLSGGVLKETKLAIHSFIKELGIGYTFINVGWWMELILPYPPSQPESHVTTLPRFFVGSGDVKSAVTRREDIGKFVARIIADPRTLNAYVFCHGDEVTVNEAYATAKEVGKEDFNSVKMPLSIDQLKEQNPIMRDYYQEMYVLGQNTVENAKQLGAIDARELYPDIKPKTLKEYATEFYKEFPDIRYDF